MINKSLLLMLYFLTLNTIGFAFDLNEQTANSLVDQISNTISSRNSQKITEFFNYYTNSEARFIKQTISVDPLDPLKQNEKSFNFNRQEFLDNIINIAKNTSEYTYKAQMTSFNLARDRRSAVVGIHIDELSIDYISNPNMPKSNISVKTVVSTNCNMNLELAASTPIITGFNCIEKVIIQ